jgi:hypothetical protein
MSYSTVQKCANDYALRGRVAGCCAKEGAENPEQAAGDLMWKVSAASDIEAAYASALASNNPNPGGDETVITDQMILSTVQANLPPPA